MSYQRHETYESPGCDSKDEATGEECDRPDDHLGLHKSFGEGGSIRAWNEAASTGGDG